ncbi:hypothetical protein [Robertmurraya siralis]|uniref:hypothetical protein n=1 Tax=Robertmurraya siralis TaxID=77777 RepID=UPI0010F9DA5B|nr:hypothetical protein [Robertmurraya siralis]
MSKNGSIKENILSIFLKEHPQLLSDSLGFQVDNIILEQRHAHRNIDIRGVDSKRRIPLYIEVQLTKANNTYLNRVIEMIGRYNESVIVWIAKSFDEEILEELKKWFTSYQKEFVDFYALSLHEDAIGVLQKLNEMYSLDIYKNFHLLREMNPLLNVELVNLQIHPSHCGQINTNPTLPDFDRTEDVKRAMLQVLRSKIPYFLNFHYDKKTNRNDRILSCGGGKTGLIYRCSAKDVRNLAFVELYFDKAENDWYEAFENIADELRKSVYPHLTFGKRRIGVYFKPKDSYEQTFEEIVVVFKKMIDGFSPYILGEKEIGMTVSVKDHDNNIMKKFVQVPIELPEQPLPTEDSYRIEIEELSELLLTK